MTGTGNLKLVNTYHWNVLGSWDISEKIMSRKSLRVEHVGEKYKHMFIQILGTSIWNTHLKTLTCAQ